LNLGERGQFLAVLAGDGIVVGIEQEGVYRLATANSIEKEEEEKSFIVFSW